MGVDFLPCRELQTSDLQRQHVVCFQRLAHPTDGGSWHHRWMYLFGWTRRAACTAGCGSCICTRCSPRSGTASTDPGARRGMAQSMARLAALDTSNQGFMWRSSPRDAAVDASVHRAVDLHGPIGLDVLETGPRRKMQCVAHGQTLLHVCRGPSWGLCPLVVGVGRHGFTLACVAALARETSKWQGMGTFVDSGGRSSGGCPPPSAHCRTAPELLGEVPDASAP